MKHRDYRNLLSRVQAALDLLDVNSQPGGDLTDDDVKSLVAEVEVLKEELPTRADGRRAIELLRRMDRGEEFCDTHAGADAMGFLNGLDKRETAAAKRRARAAKRAAK